MSDEPEFIPPAPLSAEFLAFVDRILERVRPGQWFMIWLPPKIDSAAALREFRDARIWKVRP